VADEVADLGIRLSGEVNQFLTAMERVTASGTAAATAAERAEKAALGLGEASSTAAVGVQRLEAQQLKSGASVKEAAAAQRELTAAVATNNRANAEQVAYMRATADAARREALAMGEATAAEKAMRAAAIRNAEAMNVQATAAGRAASAAAREGAAQLQAGRQAVEAADKHKAGLEKVRGGLDKAGLGVVALIGVSLKLAGDFQKDTSVLVTAAGESAGALEHVRAGIRDISKETGTPLKQLTDGMYLVEKAGYRDADALKVLRAASQGAREENASLASVTNAMTSVMASYHLGAESSVQVMNALKTAAGESKTTMEDYASALSTVIPIASANKISFDQVAGAIATLTQHGTSAAEATQEWAATISRLVAPNNVAIAAMARMGLSATDVSQNLGKRGLTGTVELLTTAILSHMGPAGLVLTSAFNQSKSAAQDVNVMMGTMHGTLLSLAQQYREGKISVGDWHKAVKALPVDQASLAGQFAVLQNRASGFNTLLRSGSPAAQTYTAALKQMAGGQIGLNTILQSSGENLGGMKTRVEAVNKSLHDGGKDVEGWEATLKLSNIQTDRARQSLVDLAIQLGTALMPAWIKVTQVVKSAADWLGKHKTVAEALAIALTIGLVGGIVAVNVALVMLAANPVTLTIMAIVGAVALLVAGFVVAWQKSEVFRDVVIGVLDMLKTGFYAMVYGVLGYFRILLTVWLETAGGILHAAALMLSWVPGLGGKLKAADNAFRGFKDGALSTIDKLRNGMKEKMDAAAKQTSYQAALTGQALVHGVADRLPAYEKIADKYGKTLPQVLRDARIPAAQAATLLAQHIRQGIASQDKIIEQQAINRATATGRRLIESTPAARQAGQDLAVSARDGAAGVGGFDTLGSNAGQGYVNGMQGMIQQASMAGANIAQAALQAVQAAQVSHSPSVLFHNMGRFAGQGYANGLASTHGMIADAAAGMAAAAVGGLPAMSGATPSGGMSGIPQSTAGSGGGGRNAQPIIHNHFYVDGKEIHTVVQTQELQYQGRNGRSAFTR